MCTSQDEKNRQRERVVAAQQDVAKSKAQLDSVDEKLRPLIELRKSRRTEQDSLRATFGDLGVGLLMSDWKFYQAQAMLLGLT